jgi:hypothetical protein
VEPEGKFDQTERLRGRVCRLTENLGMTKQMQQIKDKLNMLPQISTVGPLLEAQIELKAMLNEVDENIDLNLSRAIRQRWPEGYLAAWKEELFRQIGLDINGSEDIDAQLMQFYQQLDEKPLKQDLSDEALIGEAQNDCRVYMKNGEFPEFALEQILHNAANAIKGLGERLELTNESAINDHDMNYLGRK